MPDKLTPEQRHKCMHSIKSQDSGIEFALRKALWDQGYRYRKNFKALPGKPDIALTKYKIAIFCDSEFFHGKNWKESLLPQIQRGSNSEFWVKKISRNIERDCAVTEQLESMGWTVIRFWGKDIKNDLDGCVRAIEAKIVRK